HLNFYCQNHFVNTWIPYTQWGKSKLEVLVTTTPDRIKVIPITAILNAQKSARDGCHSRAFLEPYILKFTVKS
ncbi:hypothetical protein, partial [Vibrio sp. 10N.239.312.D08]|uniref:hypothetical protein n=1 Tax=Vibrio sp. 10N.239.312.D08 TaxID=3229978 RepID=UPI00354EBADB